MAFRKGFQVELRRDLGHPLLTSTTFSLQYTFTAGANNFLINHLFNIVVL